MGIVLLFLFLALPIAEIYVIIQVGDAIGVAPTLALLILDGFAGAALARSQGRAAWERFNRALTDGRVPANETFDGAMIIVGGALLLAPGFITDVDRLRAPDPADPGASSGRWSPASPAAGSRFGWAIPSSRPGGAGPRRAARRAGGGRARARPATTTTRAPRTRSTTRPPEIEPGEPRELTSIALEFEAPERRDAAHSSGTRRAGRARPGPGGRRRLAPARRARLGRGRAGPGALGAPRRRPPAGDRGAPPGGRRGPRRGAGRGRARSTPGEFEQLDETLLSTEYDARRAATPGRARALRPAAPGSRSGSPPTSTGDRARRQRPIERLSAALALRAAGGGGAGVLDMLERR